MTEVAERIWNDEIYETIERLNAPIPDVMPDKGSAENDVAAGVETAEDVIEATDSADAAFQTDATDETLAGTKHSPSTALAVLDTVMPLGMGPSQKEPIEFHDDGRPIIKVQQGYLRDAMGLAETCLAQSGRYFQRAGAIVEVRVDPATRETAVHDLNPMALVHALAGVSAWKRLDRRSNSWELVDPIERICKVMIKAGSFSVLPVLNGLARQPYLRPDGSVCQTAGHDPATGMFGVFNADDFDMPEAPTRKEAEQALQLLTDLISEFPFATPNDKSAALAAMLTVECNPKLTPLKE